MTPVQMFRDRWECRHIGTVIFVVQAVLLVPYIIIAVMGGGTVLRAITNGFIPYWLGGAIVSSVVMSYVFLGGMRGTALGQRAADDAVPAVRHDRGVRHRRRHGRIPRSDGGAARLAGDRRRC